MVPSFKYLGIVILAADDDCLAVIQNLTKAQAVWVRMTRILIRGGSRPQIFVFLFKAIAHSVLLFGA